MAGNELIMFYEEGDEVTCVPTSAVTGKTAVKISGDRNADGLIVIAPCGAGDKVFGIAGWDAGIGKRVTVYRVMGGRIVPMIASGALAANASVKSDASGKPTAATAGDKCFGVVVTGAADAAEAQIALQYHTA